MTEAGTRPVLRLDKWLFLARFYRTRTLAADMVSRGKVRVNTKICKKPATTVGPGDVLTLAQGGRIRVIEVRGVPERRGSATDAQAFFVDRDAGPP